MKNYYDSSVLLENQIIQFFEKLSSEQEDEIFSEVNSRSKSDHDLLTSINRIRVSSNKYFDLIRLLLLYHFGEYEKGLKSYLALDITTKLDRNFQFHWMNILYENKVYLLKWLLRTETITSQIFFGTILSIIEFKKLLKKINIQFVIDLKRPVKKGQFIRGYRDKGSLKDPSSRAREKANLTPDFNQILKRLEREYNFTLERSIFKEYLILEDRSLSEELLIKFRIIKKENILCQ